ncbi:MAG: S-methyl-5-thioribose-1-phosphate isomerase [Chloroflexota bacterium]
MLPYRAIQWIDNPPAVRMLDQRLLPQEVQYLDYTDYRHLANAIRDMVIRGAPAIGLAAAYGMALAAFQGPDSLPALRLTIHHAADTLKAARPTAVNLSWAVDRLRNRLNDAALETVGAIRSAALKEAQAVDAENLQMDLAMARHALPLIPEGANIYHHCNTGPLATGGYGTALGVIRYAHEQGKQVHVFVDETRPRLQGARLTAWELQQMGVPFTIVPDGASGHFMRTRKIDLCVVGCDRVAANGDTANKIGTYNLALAARAHGVPFYIAGPTSTVDLATPGGDAIPIEERPEDEITHVAGVRLAPEGVHVANPAFDVTPAGFITAIITEKGVAYPPFTESLAGFLRP